MSHKYRPEIDWLRALAILPVIIFHAGLGCPGGFVGVDIFFVISGFLITRLIFQEIQDGSFSLAMFWERRLRRIFPALCAMVFATLVAGWFLYLPGDFSLLAKSVAAQAVLASNFFFWQKQGYFSAGLDKNPLLHTWSLAVEEQFYLLFPLFLIFLARLKRFPLRPIIVCCALASFALSVAGSYKSPSATFYLLPTRAWELMIGVLLAVMPVKVSSRAWLNQTAALSGLGLTLGPIFYYNSGMRFPGLAALPPCLGAALMIGSSGEKPTLVSRLLAWPPIVFIGLISYPLYLWHWPLLGFSTYSSLTPLSGWARAGLLLASSVLAVASWKWIETPFRARVICSRRTQVFALAGGATLTLLLLAGAIFWRRGVPGRLPAQVVRFDNCRTNFGFRNEITPQEAAAGRFAELGAQNASQPVETLLWGDSHAMAAASALDELCRRHSVRGMQATHSSTAPILDYDSHYNVAGLHEASIPFARSVVAFVAQQHIRTVILAAQWRKYGPIALVDAKLSLTIQTLLDSGAKVYILKDVPIPDFDVPWAAALTVMHHGDLTQLVTPLDKYAADNSAYDPIFAHLGKMGARVLDTPKCFLNAHGSYDVIRDDKLLYFDSSHLSIAGAGVLVPMLEPLFKAK